MPAEKSLAIVLRVIDFSESSLIVTLFTRDFGKIGALAKGAKRPKGPFEAALDLLAVCRVVFLRKSSDSLDLLTEAKLERRFRASQSDLARLYAGYYVAELLDELTDQADPHPELFDLADTSLQALDGTGDVATIVLRFEMLALRWLGHLPLLDACVQCGVDVSDDIRTSFGLIAGGVLCAECRPGQRSIVSLSAVARKVLARFADPEEKELSIPADVRGEVRGIVNNYLAHHIGHRPKLYHFLGMLVR